MEIIFEGRHDSKEAGESLLSVLRLFKERYNIGHFREMHLSVTLMDEKGEDVELIDSETAEAYRIFEVHQKGYAETKVSRRPGLKLVVDNTHR